MRLPAVGHGQAAVQIVVVVSLVVCVFTYACVRTVPAAFFLRLQNQPNITVTEPGDELEIALKSASTENKTLIISFLNNAYVEENGMLDLFLRSLREGEYTEYLIKQLLLVSVEQVAFEQCEFLRLHCYRLDTNGTDFSEEAIYMSAKFIDIMWRRTRFLRDVLRHGYSFVFTDMDVMWLRNPFAKLNHDGEDMQISCDSYNGRPLDESNPLNTGFYFVASNNRTITMFDEWYERRNNATGLKEQDVLSQMRNEGIFRRLKMKVRYLDTLYFSGFCQDSRNFREVRTVHANCCRMVKAKLSDLTAALNFWKKFRGTSNATWPAHRACQKAWQTDISKYELQNVLQKASMANRTVIISVLNKAYAKENGMLDLFLESLLQGVDTGSLVKHLLLVAVDQIAFERCKLLKLHCYRLITKGNNLSKEQLYMSKKFINMMWQRTLFLRDVLRLGYSFIFTDMDIMWLRNPFTKLGQDGYDLQISCDQYNGNPFDESNPINTGFYFVASSNRTIALFDAWYASRNVSNGMKEQDVLGLMVSKGVFRQLSMKVRFLDTLYFSGFCQDSKDLREVCTIHANCCRSVKAKLADLSASLEVWKGFKGTKVSWPEHKACNQSWNNQSPIYPDIIS